MAASWMIGFEVTAFAGASFFFALAETAFFSLSKWQVRQLATRHPGRGDRVEALLARPQDLLATIVLGNTLANAGLVVLAFWLVQERGWAVGGTLAGVLGLILFGGEVLPKTLAVRAPEFWATRVARPLQVLQGVSRPLRWLAQRLDDYLLRRLVPAGVRPTLGPTDEEYRELVEWAGQQGALRPSEKDLILQILSLDRRTAGDVMRPRAELAALPDDLPVEAMIAAARRLGHRRLPLYDGSLDTIVSVLNTQSLLLDPEGDFAEAIEMPSFVPETMNLMTLLQSLQRQRRGLAIVLDEFGSTAGVVTTTDILGAVVGPFRPEGRDPGVKLVAVGPGQWRAEATMRLEEFQRVYPGLGEVEEVDTLGGLVLAQAGVVPPPGESVTFRGLRFTVLQAEERRVRELLVTVEGRKGKEGA